MKKHTTRVEYQRKNRRENLITVILVSIIIVIGAVALFYGTHTKFGGESNHKANHQTTTKVIKHKHHKKHHKLTIDENTQNPNSNLGTQQGSSQPNQPALNRRSSAISSSNNANNNASIHKVNPVVNSKNQPNTQPLKLNQAPTPRASQHQNAPAQKQSVQRGNK